MWCERDGGWNVCDKAWPTKRAACGTGRPDSEKWDFLSASLLQVPLLQMHLGMHEWLNQGLFDFQWLHTVNNWPLQGSPPTTCPPPVLAIICVSRVFYHSLIANKHAQILPFSRDFVLNPLTSLTSACFQPGCVIHLGFLRPCLKGRF